MNIKEIVGNNIKYYKNKLNLTSAQLAEKLGVAKSAITAWEQAISMPKAETIFDLCQIFNITPSQLYSESPELVWTQYKNTFPIAKQKIPLLGSIACGQPIYASEDRESYVEIGTEIKADFCVKAQGDSMINARIKDGDIVFIKQQPMVENGEIAAVLIDDSVTLKRVYYEPNKQKIILNAENPKYPPMIYDGSDLEKIKILGKAVAFESDIE